MNAVFQVVGAFILGRGNFITATTALFQGGGRIQIGDALQALAGIWEIQGNASVAANSTMTLQVHGNIMGSGTLQIDGNFIWSGGIMQGSLNGGSTTLIYGTMTLNFSQSDSLLLLSRILTNYGTMTLSGNADEADTLDVSRSQITNYGSMALNAPSTGSVRVDYFTLIGSFINQRDITVTGGEVDLKLPGNDEENVSENYGNITVTSGSLNLTQGLVTYGYLQANGGATVNFDVGLFQFMNCGTSDMMRGAGSFVVNDAGATIRIQQGADITASNFYLDSGTLEGQGTFEANYFGWYGGTMADQGVTLVGPSDYMVISADTATIDQRTLQIQGAVLWYYSQTIALEEAAQILIDGGTFNTLVGGDGTISSDNSATQIQVIHSGTFTVSNGDSVTIGPTFRNNSGSVYFEGNTTIPVASGRGGYYAVGIDTYTEFGNGSYDFGAFSVTTGIAVLNGGNLSVTTTTDNLFTDHRVF